MREILFRGKLKGRKVWAEGNLHIDGKGVCIITPDETVIGKYGQVDPETVGQYTGLDDSNGMKIFEGDIVEGNSEYYVVQHPNGRIVYDGGQFLIAFDTKLEDIEVLGAWNEEIEVIGNIYDNPKLLRLDEVRE